MLVLSRKANESILVGDNVVFTIVEIRFGKVRVGIRAPRGIPVLRQMGTEEVAPDTIRGLPETVRSTETAPPNSTLILSRKVGESILVGSDVVFTVVDIRGDKVRIGIQTPKDLPVHRQEIVEAIEWEAAQRRLGDAAVAASALVGTTVAGDLSTSVENAVLRERTEVVASNTGRGLADTVHRTDSVTPNQPAAPEWPRFCAELRELRQKNLAEWKGIDALEIALYLTGKCSPEEVAVIQNGISRSPRVRDWIELARKILLADDVVEEEPSMAIAAIDRLTPEKQYQVYRRLLRELDEYSSQLKATWGDIDESLIERYLDNECTDAERARVEQAMRDYPAVRECVELAQQVTAEFFLPENPA